MKLPLFLWVSAIAWFFAPAAVAGQQSDRMGGGKRQDLVVPPNAQGETIMWIAEAPNLPPSSNPVVMVAESRTQQAKNILGICMMVHGENNITPEYFAQQYLDQFSDNSAYKDIYAYGATVKVTQQPKSGILRITPEYGPDSYSYNYIPNQLPSGTKDYLVVSVENKGVTVNIRYYIYIDYLQPNEPADLNWCGDKTFWKISQDPNGSPILTAVNYPSPFTSNTGSSSTDTATQASTLSTSVLSSLSVDPSTITFNLADLAGGAVGQVVGTPSPSTPTPPSPMAASTLSWTAANPQ